MGRAKELLQEREADLEWARDLLIESGAVKECEIHSDVYVDQLDPGAVEEALALAKESRPQVAAEPLIQQALADIGDECGWCCKNRDD